MDYSIEVVPEYFKMTILLAVLECSLKSDMTYAVWLFPPTSRPIDVQLLENHILLAICILPYISKIHFTVDKPLNN